MHSQGLVHTDDCCDSAKCCSSVDTQSGLPAMLCIGNQARVFCGMTTTKVLRVDMELQSYVYIYIMYACDPACAITRHLCSTSGELQNRHAAFAIEVCRLP